MNRLQIREQLTRWSLLVAVAALAVAGYTVFGHQGWMDLQELRRERAELETRVRELREENEQLRQRLERLESNPEYLEWLARDRLGMVKPNERVVIVPPERRGRD